MTEREKTDEKVKSDRGGLEQAVEMQGTLRDFILPIVEFLGILVPGVFFIFALIPALIIPTTTILRIIEGAHATAPIASEYLVTIILSPSAGTIFLLAIFSYIFGHIFFRQDPKVPDQQSFKKVNDSELCKEEGPVRMCDEEIEDNKEKNKNRRHKTAPEEHNLEFPYRYLYEYLHDRDMKHLADIVQWRGNQPDTYSNRTKHFMNVIKVRLEFLFPYQYIRIQRNEAHVRLMSSMWYASKSLIIASIIGSFIGGICIFLYWYTSGVGWPFRTSEVLYCQ